MNTSSHPISRNIKPCDRGLYWLQRCCLVMLGLMLLAQPTPTTAEPGIALGSRSATRQKEDVVFLAPAKPGGPSRRVTGKILDYNGQHMTFRQASGMEATFPAKRIVKYQSTWLSEHAEGDQLYRKGQLKQAVEKYRAAIRQESRRWVRRLILANMIDCDYNLGHVDRAAKEFATLVSDDPQVLHFDRIPLCWRTRVPPPSLERQAKDWIQKGSTPVSLRLLAASWLLATRDRAIAKKQLEHLSINRDRRIASLAAAQLWRMEQVTATAKDVRRWRLAVEKMPCSIRSGPYFIVGLALARQAQQAQQSPQTPTKVKTALREQATLSLLHIPILYPRQRTLAAESLLAAGELLERCGYQKEANRLYQEIIDDHPENRLADIARQRMEASATQKKGSR